MDLREAKEFLNGKGYQLIDEATSKAVQEKVDWATSILNDFANICQLSGLYTKAADIQKEAVSLAETLYGKRSEAYSDATARLLQYSSTTNDVIELRSMIDRGNMKERDEV